jgi:hypothetical protein
MNRFFSVFVLILLILSSVFLLFFFRDAILKGQDLEVDDCVPINLQVQDSSRNSMTISWETKEKCLGLVRYGDSPETIDYMAVGDSETFAKTKHSVEINSLMPSTVYYFVISSGGVEYGNEGSPMVLNTRAY